MKNDYKGVAAAGGGRITGSVKYFKAHPDDVGAMIHETAHVVQRYRGRNNPGWLVEGVADYVRFFKFEPGKIGPINPDQARYNSSYRVTAAFLAYLTEKYDKEIVLKLNKAMREGRYKEALFKDTDRQDRPGTRRGMAGDAPPLISPAVLLGPGGTLGLDRLRGIDGGQGEDLAHRDRSRPAVRAIEGQAADEIKVVEAARHGPRWGGHADGLPEVFEPVAPGRR